jgi:hypothetical protein
LEKKSYQASESAMTKNSNESKIATLNIVGSGSHYLVYQDIRVAQSIKRNCVKIPMFAFQ